MVDVKKYTFESAGFAGATMGVREVRFAEALNEPYRMSIEISLDESDADATAMVGKDAAFVFVHGEVERRVVGLATAIETRTPGKSDDPTRARVMVLPALALLALRRNTRMFQEKTVPEILETVLNESLGPYSRKIDVQLTGTYDPREYCLQYQESDLAFVHRLMEEEGISYSFDHTGEQEVMVLADDNAAFQLTDQIIYSPGDARGHEGAGIFEFRRTLQHTTTSVLVRDFDWTQGTIPFFEEAAGEDALGRVRESYEHGRGRSVQIGSYDEGAMRYTKHNAARQKDIRREEAVRDAFVGRGRSRAPAIMPGKKIALTNHTEPGLDGEYLVLRATHTVGHDQYTNEFVCIPADTVYRPRRITPKPFISGVQTAVVTGPSGEEIHVDKYGRIKARFHWDRENPADETSSCWMRVKQEWAGANWGFWWVPRIGMEVLVHFVDGDPDRPLVTGTAYNADNTLPYPLPDEKTKSTIKSNSSLGGGGNNEFRYEDKKGSEQIFTHAQKDYNEVVENDHTTLVKNNQSNEVDVDQKQTIHVDQTERVDVNSDMSVGGNRTVHVEGNFDEKIDGTETRTVNGAVDETFSATETRTIGGSVTETIGSDETRTISSSQSETIGGSHTLTVGGSQSLTIAGSLSETITGGITTLTPASITATIGGPWNLTGTGGITFIVGGGVTIIAPGGVQRVDSKIDIQAGTTEDTYSFQGEFYAEKLEACGLDLSFAGLRVNDMATEAKYSLTAAGARALRARIAALRNRKAGADVQPAQDIKA